VTHPEVKNRDGRLVPVGSSLYQGFGPLVNDRDRHTTTLKANAAIQAGDTAALSFAVPKEHALPIEQALWLMDRYGTLGGRSRNGWGSFSLHPLAPEHALAGSVPLRPWRECLDCDWPHAIGADDTNTPLIWQTEPQDDWKSLMKTLAILKIGLRTQFIFHTGNDTPATEPRHWLSHPVTKHNVADWRQGRLPNTLRFKVRPCMDARNKLVGVIFHVPCLPPDDFRPDPPAIRQTWQAVHALLGELTRPAISRRYASIVDASRRAELKPQLDSIVLSRIPE
jgi:CRISPR-associated protein Cmr1